LVTEEARGTSASVTELTAQGQTMETYSTNTTETHTP